MTCFLINNQASSLPSLPLLSLRTGWGGGPESPRPVQLRLEGGVQGRAQGGGPWSFPDIHPKPSLCGTGSQFWVGPGLGDTQMWPPTSGSMKPRVARPTDTLIPRAGATEVSGRAELETASLA